MRISGGSYAQPLSLEGLGAAVLLPFLISLSKVVCEVGHGDMMRKGMKARCGVWGWLLALAGAVVGGAIFHFVQNDKGVGGFACLYKLGLGCLAVGM